jgi:hypothetical protein
MSEHRPEVADVFRTYGDDFLGLWERVLSRPQRKAFDDIRACRTAALGGHLDQCDQCGHRAISYNSCLMGSNSLWGLERGNMRKTTTRSHFSLSIKNPGKNPGLPRPAAPVGRVDPDRMPQTIGSRLVASVASEAVLT